ncbi:MAG: TonB-linked SusC/RagA family outer membrane protein [Polaribacter sp.]
MIFEHINSNKIKSKMKTKFKGILTLLLAIVVQVTFAQEKTISGTVSDKSGVLPGVSVVIEGSNKGVETDFDGKYSIEANSGDVFVFRYLGYETAKITVATSNIINVTLVEGGEVLDEIVITAFGIKRSEKALGYSVQSIKGESMTEARESNITNAISGKIAGVQVTGTSGSVGASSRIVLRGNSSITGNNEPLYVVDGVPISNSSFGNAGSGGGVDLPNGAADINPDDIESITVLKGPNAAALYGLRAGNGVIVITTKKGDASKKFSVSINTNVTMSNPLLLPDYQNSYGQGGDTTHFNYLDGASGGIGDGVDESWGPALDAGLEFVQWDSQLTNNGNPTPWISHPDNVKDFLNTGINISNNVSITSGGFRLSIGNSEQEGMVPFTELKKFTVGVSGSLKLGERLNASVSVNYFNQDSDNIPTSGYNNENPFQQFIWSARQVNFTDLRNWRDFPLAPENTAAAGTPLNWNHNFQNNPYWVLETNRNTFSKDRLIGNIDLTSQLTDDLTLSTKLGIDSFSQFTTNRQAVGSNNAQNGYYAERQIRFEEVNASFLLNYNKNFTDDFAFSINFGGNHMNRNYDRISGSLPALELPNLYNLSNLQTGSTANIGNDHSGQQINSLLAFGQFSYKDMFFIDFTGRNDWSSILPSANNSFFYPSLAGSAVLTDVFPILKENNFNFLKLRGSWAEVGSTGALNEYSLNQTFGLSNSGFGNQASVPNTQYNPNLKAETVTSVEFGIDGKMFGNRLRFSATYYDTKSTDLLVPIQVTAATGFTNVWDNIADMSNTGYELQLGGTIIKKEDFSFDIDVNFAQNKNEVTSLGDLDTYVLGGQWGLNLEARPGQPYGSLVGRDFERTTGGDVIYENGLPLIDSTQKIIGNIAPDWTGGATFSIRYKAFDFSTLIDAKIGGDVHSMTYSWGRYAGTLSETLIGRETGVVGNGVMSDGNGGYVANNVTVSAKSFNQSSYSNSIESSAIFDASYVKLRQISIGYTLPREFIENSVVKSLKVSIVGRNLLILHKNTPHIDPETGFSASNGNQGQEFGQYPSSRNIGFNINMRF